jgi:hypothetical protein
MHHSKINTHNLAAMVFVSFLITGAQINVLTGKELELDSKMKVTIVESISDLVIEKYVSPDIALQVKEYLVTRLRNGAYDKTNTAGQFANALWQDLHESSNDNHFFIEYNPERARLVTSQKSQSVEEIEKADKEMTEKDRLTNFGFKKLEVMKGNVGYLDLEFFSNPDYAGPTAVAAMNFLANSDAVIIDLRDTPGGEPTMVQLLSSYFVRGTKQGRTHLNTQEQIYDGSIEQYWTISYVPGKRMYDMDLYVLTDEYTGSAAEAFAYSMKALNRATMVGETTRGSAHNVDIEVIQDSFVMHLPVRRPVNPITGTNWEHTGVEPHIVVPGKQALDKAYLTALEKILKKTKDDDQRFKITWAIDGARAQLEPVTLDEDLILKYIGSYGERKITYENGELFYQRTGPKYRLVPLKDNLFALDGLDYFRIEMTTDKKGKVTALVGLYDDGRKDPSKRTN